MVLKNMKSFFLLIVLTLSLLNPLARSAPLEEGVLLRQLADSYSAPLVASFLNARMKNNAKMVEDIRNSLPNSNANQQNLFTLKVKSLEALDKQLDSLQKTDYFNFNGTERIKYFIEQYILNNEILPIELKPEEEKFNSTPDDLLRKVNIESNDNLIQEIHDVITAHLADIEEKETNETYNELQKLTASLTKRELKSLSQFKYTQPHDQHDEYGNYLSTIDERASQIKFVCERLKSILNFYQLQFANLAS